jgi:hypothetical protein
MGIEGDRLCRVLDLEIDRYGALVGPWGAGLEVEERNGIVRGLDTIQLTGQLQQLRDPAGQTPIFDPPNLQATVPATIRRFGDFGHGESRRSPILDDRLEVSRTHSPRPGGYNPSARSYGNSVASGQQLVPRCPRRTFKEARTQPIYESYLTALSPWRWYLKHLIPVAILA